MAWHSLLPTPSIRSHPAILPEYHSDYFCPLTHSLCLLLAQVVELTEPYINGFLAFREVPHYLSVLQRLEREHGADCRPDLLMVPSPSVPCWVSCLARSPPVCFR